MGAVAVGEFTRRFRVRSARRSESEAAPDEGAIETLQTAGRASKDTVRVAVEGYATASRAETVLINLLTGFAGSFAVARLSTGGIRSGWWPFRDVTVGGRHVHHFVPGILLAFGSATVALLVEDEDRQAALALPFGVGVGLTFDEAALLLDFRDVYWTREGLLSVQLSLGALALVSGTLLGLRLLRRGERRAIEIGDLPDGEDAFLAASPVAQPTE